MGEVFRVVEDADVELWRQGMNEYVVFWLISGGQGLAFCALVDFFGYPLRFFGALHDGVGVSSMTGGLGIRWPMCIFTATASGVKVTSIGLIGTATGVGRENNSSLQQ